MTFLRIATPTERRRTVWAVTIDGRLEWMADAAWGRSSVDFFDGDERSAVAVCRSCPVITTCRGWSDEREALEHIHELIMNAGALELRGSLDARPR